MREPVAIVPCSGIGKTYGSVTREAAYAVEELRPETTEIVPLSLLVLGDAGAQAAVREAPVITLDGCKLACATVNVRQAGGVVAREYVAHDPGSPCGLPFRVIRQSPMYVSAQKRLRKPKCDKGYVLLKDAEGKYSRCQAKESNEHHFCICNGLLNSAGYNSDVEQPLYTVGTSASRVNRILTVKSLMDELTGRVLVPAV